jgi:hypothetical protein
VATATVFRVRLDCECGYRGVSALHTDRDGSWCLDGAAHGDYYGTAMSRHPSRGQLDWRFDCPATRCRRSYRITKQRLLRVATSAARYDRHVLILGVDL